MKEDTSQADTDCRLTVPSLIFRIGMEIFPELFDVVTRKTISPLISFVLAELINFESSHNYYNFHQTICRRVN